MRIFSDNLITSALLIFAGAIVLGIWRDMSLFLCECTIKDIAKITWISSVLFAFLDVLFAVLMSVYLVIILYYCSNGVFRAIYPMLLILEYLCYKLTLSRLILKLLVMAKRFTEILLKYLQRIF